MARRRLLSLLSAWMLVLQNQTAFSVPAKLIQFGAESGDATEGCRQFCRDDPQCTGFAVYPDERTVPGSDERVAPGASLCYLLDRHMQALTAAIPEAFAPSGLRNGTTGTQTTRMFKNPFVSEANVFSSTPQHFVRGCEYTISLWVWLYKPRVLPDNELVIFSTREVMGQRGMYHDEALLPAIVFNVGGAPDRTSKFFFSATKDDFHNYHGFWGGGSEVRYHEWTHLALVVNGDLLIAYINGAHAGMVSMSPPRQGAMYCPYDRAPPGPHTSPRAQPVRPTEAELMHAPLSLAPYPPSQAINNTVLHIAGSNAHNVASTPALFLDLVVVRNAMLSQENIWELMRQREPPRLAHLQALLRAYGKHSLEGFCPTDFTGWHNGWLQRGWGLCPEAVCGAVSLDEAFRLGVKTAHREMKRFKETAPRGPPLSPIPSPSPSSPSSSSPSPAPGTNAVKAPLRPPFHERHPNLYDNYDDYSEEELDALYNEELDEEYYAQGGGAYAADDYMYGASAADVYADEVGYDEGVAGDMGAGRGARGAMMGEGAPGAAGPGALNGRPRGERHQRRLGNGTVEAARRNDTVPPRWQAFFPAPLLKSAAELAQHGVKMTARRRGRLQRLGMPLSSYYGQDEAAEPNSVWTEARRWLGEGWDRLAASVKGIIGGDPFGAAAGTAGANATANATTSNASASAAASGPAYMDTVSELYNSAMLWLSDRHDGFASTAALPLPEWKAAALERASSALTLALWLADEERAPGVSMGWSLRSAPPVSQPIHLALAFLAGFDALDEVRLPSDVGIYLTSSLGGGELVDLLGMSRPAGRHHAALGLLTGLPTAGESEMKCEEKIGDGNWFSKVAEVGGHGTFGPEGIHEVLKPLAVYVLTLNGTGTEGRAREAASKALLDMHAAQAAGHIDAPAAPYSKPAAAIAPPASAAPTPSSGLVADTECFAAAAHYFPVAQFVAGHFGLVETGVGLLEDVRIATASESAFLGQQGEEDELQLHHEAEAEAGDAQAQMWLGRRFFWGYGGLRPNAVQARRWFERAAAQGDPEGLYNLGVFHNNGQAGLPVNPELGLDFFMRAANAPVPFAMALHAVGQHFLRHDHGLQNLTLAKDYFTRAAELSSPDGHFSLAMMHRDGSAGQVNVPLCVVHLALAIGLGHIRASNFLAHGLLDPDSWFNLYAREEAAAAQVNATYASLWPGTGADHQHEHQHQQQQQETEQQQQHSASYGKEEEYSINQQWAFNASLPIYIALPHGTVPLPVPLGSGSTCSVALHLLKNIAENSHRTNDLCKEALSSYLAGDYWTALDLYDEAAQLGVQSAMENSAWIYELLRERQCGAGARGGEWSRVAAGAGPVVKFMLEAAESAWETVKSSAPLSSSYLPPLPRAQCDYYFSKMTARRWVQLANSGDVVARREMAHRHLRGDKHGPVAGNASASALLYALAAEQGDVHSLVNLAWLLAGTAGAAASSTSAIPVNTTAARSLLRAAIDLELSPDGHGLSTEGVASQVALAWLSLLDWARWASRGLGGAAGTAAAEVALNLVSLTDRRYTHRRLSEWLEGWVVCALSLLLLLGWRVRTWKLARRRRVGREHVEEEAEELEGEGRGEHD